MTEFDDVIRLLREHRPEATALELDRIKQRARARVARPSRRSQRMKSRLAILSMLVGGLLMSMTGASLAISGMSANTRDAAVAQYGGGVAPEEQSPTPSPGGGVAPEEQSHPANKPAAAQPTRQVEAGQSTNELPFTGFAAIPVLLAGVALLGGGIVVRRRTRAQN
ncbi:MAG TPA: hypothetical protein VH418_16180 [Solirubrobacteraceae bacterium]|jgi:hypothetical protein